MKDEEAPRPDELAPDRRASAVAERLCFALAAAHMGVFEWDSSSDALTWSSATTGLGLSAEQAPTSGRAFFEFVHPDDREAVRANRVAAIRDRADAIVEFRILSPDGVVHWVEAHGRVIYDTDGRPLRILGVNTEITERKSLEAQLRDAHRQVERLNILKATMRTVQDIVGNALTSLQLFGMEAKAHVPPASLQSFNDIIMETAARLTALGDLDLVTETEMVMGTGIEYHSPTAKPSRGGDG